MEKRFDPIHDKTTDMIEFIMQSPDLPDDPAITFKVNLCAEEVIKNLVDYAYENGQGYVVVKTERVGDRLVLTFRDEGVPFNPLAKEDPDVTLPAEERSIGGLGIFLCKKMMDRVSYTFENGCNIFQMEIKVNN